ncbi:prostaglandin E synthase 2 [Formica exsecta]|uniref:prostaglandin E synthase 2 n=1 Tax=Formica exsecta TaxID=72781 RepID=UPI0011445438|nr:prostaglandin E synthase 2 [Formica exsecta]
MAAVHKFTRLIPRAKFFNNNGYYANENLRSFCTMVQQPQKTQSLVKISLIGAVTGVALGAGYAYHKINKIRQNLALEGTQAEITLLKYKPSVTPSRKVIFPVDSTDLNVTLFQYQTCPFCCKVRVFLDYYGISYDVVEVDPVLRKEIGWSSYKKVPILLTKVGEGYQPLNDSSMIISLLASYLHDKSYKVEELTTLSPNVYRTIDESYRTFNWFSKVGKWEEYFPLWERMLIVNVGAMAMWLIGKRLKKRHRLKDDVRQSLYDEANYWLRAIRARNTPFMGGSRPDLSDLAVYGILKSIEGCDAFQDLLAHTKISVWYNAMKEQVDTHSGSANLSR